MKNPEKSKSNTENKNEPKFKESKILFVIGFQDWTLDDPHYLLDLTKTMKALKTESVLPLVPPQVMVVTPVGSPGGFVSPKGRGSSDVPTGHGAIPKCSE